MESVQNFVVNYGSLSDMLSEYKKKFNVSNMQLSIVLGVTTQTVSRWSRGGEPKKSELKDRLSRLFQLDFFKDNMTQVINGMDKVNIQEEKVTDDSMTNNTTYEKNTWSVSRVKTWLDNPWDFYCKYIKGMKRASPWQDALDRGTVLHRYLEELALGKNSEEIESDITYTNEEATRYNQLLEDGEKVDVGLKIFLKRYFPNLEEKIESLEPIPVLSEKGIADGIRVARKYLDEYGTIHNMGKVIEAEKKIEWDLSEYLPNQSFVGYIDAVVEDNRGRIWLVDHKTYSNKPKFDDLRMELQANVYMYVMKHVYNVDVAGFIYDCINPKEKITGRGYHFHQFKITYNERIVEMVVENFMTTIEIILNYPDYTIYKESTYGTAFMEELVHGFENQYKPKITGIEEDDE